MKVYKFGGASVCSAEGVENLRGIVEAAPKPLFVIVSAMGKTTNALEKVTELFVGGDRAAALEHAAQNECYHMDICERLFPDSGGGGVPGDEDGGVLGGEAPGGAGGESPSGAGDGGGESSGGGVPDRVRTLFEGLKKILAEETAAAKDYDYWYDRIVSHGELISTLIVSEYLTRTSVINKWIDIRECYVTDSRHRDANVDLELSGPLLRDAVADGNVFISQGFIGADRAGDTTTLGREGSDYSAAVAANLLDADSLTIWKDVVGVMNGDPKIFPDAVHIPELTYLDAVELAYSGAQIIHPKTIKPLQNKDIPLYVRSFAAPAASGSVIQRAMDTRIEIPILILKHNQILVSIRPNDFSFVLEDRLAAIFALFERYGIKINLIQSSAVNLSVCVDESRHLPEVVAELLAQGFRVVYNTDMQLFTIRGYTAALYAKYASGDDVFLTQKTRRTLRLVRRKP